jgi:hypothetical protein
VGGRRGALAPAPRSGRSSPSDDRALHHPRPAAHPHGVGGRGRRRLPRHQEGQQHGPGPRRPVHGDHRGCGRRDRPDEPRPRVHAAAGRAPRRRPARRQAAAEPLRASGAGRGRPHRRLLPGQHRPAASGAAVYRRDGIRRRRRHRHLARAGRGAADSAGRDRRRARTVHEQRAAGRSAYESPAQHRAFARTYPGQRCRPPHPQSPRGECVADRPSRPGTRRTRRISPAGRAYGDPRAGRPGRS